MNIESLHKSRLGSAAAAPDSPTLLLPYLWIGGFLARRRRRLAARQHMALARRLRQEGYGHALVMPRTWKSALAPYLAGIPQRTGFIGEGRVGLINDLRWGERQLPRMIERCAALALPKGETLPTQWPLPELAASRSDVATWRARLRPGGRRARPKRVGAPPRPPPHAFRARPPCQR